MILTCKCNHPMQDAIHGKGKRVCNELKKVEKSSQQYRCTVCGTLHTAPSKGEAK